MLWSPPYSHLPGSLQPCWTPPYTNTATKQHNILQCWFKVWKPHKMADNYPTYPVRNRDNSLHMGMGRLLPSAPKPFITPLLLLQELVSNKSHLGIMCTATTSPAALHFKVMRQTLQAHLGQQTGVVQPWRIGHCPPGQWGNLAYPTQGWRGVCVPSQYLWHTVLCSPVCPGDPLEPRHTKLHVSPQVALDMCPSA